MRSTTPPWLGLAVLLATATAAGAGERFALRQAALDREPAAGPRFRVQARLAPAERAGELREGERFVLLGRLAKAAAACGGDPLFRNGFEGS